MKLFHKIKAILLRRKLIRQRAENIATLLAGRRAAKLIKIEMVRNLRLAGCEKRPACERYPGQKLISFKSNGQTAGGQTNGQISAVLAKVRFERAA